MYEVQVAALAAIVGNGQHTGLECPACAGATDDRALSMYVDGGTIRAICHRASCGFKYSNAQHSARAIERPSRTRPYMGELHTLDATDLQWLAGHFHLKAESVRSVRKSDGRYFLPIVDPEGTRRGWVSRRPWAGSPLYESGDVSPKSLTYMENEEPVQSWNGRPHVNPVVVVEDQISALRVTQDTALRSVAILGTGVNEEKVAELQRHTYHIVLALDSDATGQAFSHARKWGQAFETCRVLILRRDLKDETPKALQKIFSQIVAI